MEQRPGILVEQAPQVPRSGENYGSPELGHGNSIEHHEHLDGAPAPIETESPALSVPVLPVPLVVDDNATASSSQTTSVDTPDSAADDDLIEKEWVDKAKKIVENTKDDPFRREQEIGHLQREYIKKRYGRDVGESGV